MPDLNRATARGNAASAVSRHVPPTLAFVVIWSKKEPHRVGEIAFFAEGLTLMLGRGGEDIRSFASFGPQRPGEPFPDHFGLVGCLDGETFSRRHATARAGKDSIHVERLPGDGAAMLHNGVEVTEADVRPGDVLRFQGELALLCIWRPRTLPPLLHATVAHVFGQPDGQRIIGESLVTWLLRDEIAAAAALSTDVLLDGPRGSGKELTAHAIHALSKRARGPFVVRNAAMFTVNLSENKLFGNLKNYPQVGLVAGVGAFPEADKGTFFLDEIADLPDEAQRQLLRALEYKTYSVQGESIVRTADVRLIGASNGERKPLHEDLRDRCKQTIRLAPLSERREDIPLLLPSLLHRYLNDMAPLARFFEETNDGQIHLRISGRLVEYLVRAKLLGNTRELEKLLLAAALKSPGDVVEMLSARDLPVAERDAANIPYVPDEPEAPVSASPITAPAVSAVSPVSSGPRSDPSRAEFTAAWVAHKGVASAVAEALDMQRNKVYRVAKTYGLRE